MHRIIKISLVALLLTSCDKPFDLDLRQAPPKLVIEALLTDMPNQQSVKISWSAEFYGSGRTPRVTDAAVQVTDDTGTVYAFLHNPRNHADSMGIYLPEVPFTGVVGRTYTLSVEAAGEQYEATDRLLPVTPIDDLEFHLNEDQQEDADIAGKIYEMRLFVREPQEEVNYYLFKYYRNDSLVVFSENDIYYSDDKFFTENINGVPSPVYYAADDLGRLEAYSLTRSGYIFYADLSTNLNNDGGMFGPVPAPPRTNLSNGALGFFQVSAVVAREATLE